MTAQPLSHHQILALAEPFVRRGLHVDLAASDRLERRVLFKPVTITDGLMEHPLITETYSFVDSGTTRGIMGGGNAPRITRSLKTGQHDLIASVSADGHDGAEIIARLAAVPLERFFVDGPGAQLAHAFLMSSDPEAHLTLLRTHATAAGLHVLSEMPEIAGYPADITITDPKTAISTIDDDLLQILGRRWARLETRQAKVGQAWRSMLRVKRSEPQRSEQAASDIAAAVTHIARVFSDTPAAYHEAFARQRWAVTGRRAIPLLASIALLAVGSLAMKIPWVHGSALQMLIFNSPPLLLIALFSMRELPRIEIPRIPRQSQATSWWTTDMGNPEHERSAV